jgi:hypothetical protein
MQLSRVVRVIIAVGLVGGCSSTYVNLEAHPNSWVCPGTPVVLKWAASRSPTLAALPETGELGCEATAGERRVWPSTDTKFFIKAGHWSSFTQTEADVKMYDPNVASFPQDGSASGLQFARLGSDVHCVGSTAYVEFDQSPADWDPRLTVQQVKSLGADVTVRHRGTVGVINKSASSSFRDLPVTGVWILETTCDPRPHGIGIELTAACKGASDDGGTKP